MRIINGWLDVAVEIDYLNKSMPRDGYTPKYIVLHSTAGGSSAQAIAQYFATSDVDASSHFIIGQDGTIVQGISCDMAAWANCCLTGNYASYLDSSINQNLYTISIEHCKPSTDNSDALTQAQQDASFQLVACICDAYNIPKRPADATGGILDHAQIDPVNRARCPGPYPHDQLYEYLAGGITPMNSIPSGWHDDGQTLTATNGQTVVLGFRDYILSHSWDAANVPEEREYNANPVLLHAPEFGAGDRQCFRDGLLWWTGAKGVIYEGFMGWELDAAYKQIATLQAQIANTQPSTLAGEVAGMQSDLKQIAAVADKYK